MSIYNDLRILHKEWHENRWDAYVSLVQFTRLFCLRFKEFIEAPDYFHPDFGERTMPYVALAKVDPLDLNKEYRLHELEPHSAFDEHLTEEKEDGLIFGMRIYVESGPSTLPKHPFWFRFCLKPGPNNCDMAVFSRFFQIDMKNERTWLPAFEYMISQIKAELNANLVLASEDAQPKALKQLAFYCRLGRIHKTR